MHLSRSPYYQGNNFNSKTFKGIALKENTVLWDLMPKLKLPFVLTNSQTIFRMVLHRKTCPPTTEISEPRTQSGESKWGCDTFAHKGTLSFTPWQEMERMYGIIPCHKWQLQATKPADNLCAWFLLVMWWTGHKQLVMDHSKPFQPPHSN